MTNHACTQLREHFDRKGRLRYKYVLRDRLCITHVDRRTMGWLKMASPIPTRGLFHAAQNVFTVRQVFS